MKIIPHIQDGGIVLDTKMGEAAEVRFVWAGGWDEEVTLTIDEARALRDQLTALLPAARTPADVLTDPQPGAVWTEYAAWPDGFITDIDDTGRATLDASENRDSIVRVWAFEPPKSYQHACELAAASDVPPPTP